MNDIEKMSGTQTQSKSYDQNIGSVKIPLIAPSEVRKLLVCRVEIAFLDVREEHSFAQAHPLFATSLPLSQLELQILDRVPRKSTLITLYDSGELYAQTAARRIQQMGYHDVRILAGGLEGWRSAGYELFQDVNSACKAFGELVEARRGTPSLSADELNRNISDGGDLIVLDVRRFDEFQTMNIPGAISVPGAEIVARANSIAPNDETRIIVNCAGRTRSIIGAQSLINAGYGTRVAALRNGTMGWNLAGFELEQGADRSFEDTWESDNLLWNEKARDVAYRAGVRVIDWNTLSLMQLDGHRSVFCFDVRLPSEYYSGHISGFQNVAGGQLVQETDSFASVRGARIVLHDPMGSRAYMTASWLAQMGWEVYVLVDPNLELDQISKFEKTLPPIPKNNTITPENLAHFIENQQVTIIDISPSNMRAKGHIPESWFAIRSELPKVITQINLERNVVLCSLDGLLAAYAASEFEYITGIRTTILEGGLNAWREAGQPVSVGLGNCLSKPIDVYKRPFEGMGNEHKAMQAYLDWEYGLVKQLERDATHGFYVI